MSMLLNYSLNTIQFELEKDIERGTEKEERGKKKKKIHHLNLSGRNKLVLN